jgi:uncharacterized protein (DUF305 family)
MIQHHEGAIKMVADLNATPLSMQDFVIAALANDIDADQRAEIHKMYSMLEELR